jgi:diamine N-acetyltransferase
MNKTALEWPALRLYELISGPADQERRWDEVRELFLPGARLRLNGKNPDGSPRHLDITVGEFAELATEHYRQRGFWEREIARQVHYYGNIGHIFSTYETRMDGPETDPIARGINSIQMFRGEEAWKIASVVFHVESPSQRIPPWFLRGEELHDTEKEKAPTADSTVTLREINDDTVRALCALSVREDQGGFVAPNAFSIAQAYFEKKAWFRGIYADETPVGFVMLSDDREKPEYYLWRFMIDSRYQGMDLGRRAIELLIEHVRALPDATELLTSVVEAEGGPQEFYEKLGFQITGAYEEGEAVMRLGL